MNKIIKLIFLLAFYTIPCYSYAQEEDFYEFMGASRDIILKINQENKRILNGNYYELVYATGNGNLIFAFDDKKTCYSVMIHKEIKDYDVSRLILLGDFPNQMEKNNFLLFWNTRMMAFLVKTDNSYMVIYEKVNLQMIKNINK